MLESDFWKDLAAQFRVLNDPSGVLYAHWTRYDDRHWELIRGEFSTLAAQYEPLARRGGTQLDRSRDSLEVWLDAMRAEPGFVYDEITDVETGAVISCSIYSLRQRSADFCNILESRALEKERVAENEEREQSDPRNWTPLHQELEAIEAIKKLYAQPPKEISEALVRNLIAQREGIKPEDVPLKRIRFEVSGLLKHYGPTIKLVPQDARPLAESIRNDSSQSIDQSEPRGPTQSSKTGERQEIVAAYLNSFPEKIAILDICWAARQRYREWKRWIKGARDKRPIPDGSKADRAFRAILTSKTRPLEYRAEPRPPKWQ